MKRITPEELEPWDDERWRQLKLFEKLLHECVAINNANNIIQRLTYLTETAESLQRWDFDNKKKSFFHFLQDYAIAYDVKQKREQAQ